MASQWLKARQTKYASYATIYILIVVAVIVVANVLANRYEKTYDATANKRYSLSNETKKIVDELKQPATITYFNQSGHFREGKSLLDEYADLSSKVHVVYVDPDKDPGAARAAGIRKLNTATVAVGTHTETASDMTEEGITGALIRDIKGNTRTVCFVTGSGEHQIDDTGRDGLSHLKDLLGRDSYQTQPIDLVTQAQVPAACTAIVIAGPTHDYQQPEVGAIKTYVDNGGRAFFMLDPPLKMGPSQIGDNDALTSLLSGWGVTMDKDLVLDMNPIGQIAGLGPQVPLVTSYTSQPIVADMKGTATGFPISRSLTTKSTGTASVEPLFSSSQSSLATTNLSSPRVDVKDPNNKKGPLVLAAAATLTGGKPNQQGRLVAIGSSIWASNRFIDFNGNGDLASNAINWLTSDEDLISIRPRAPEDRRITMTQGQLRTVRIVSQFVLPLIVILAGILVWWKRR
jgi:gliding motility-associatede transport system auxiliary component